MCTTSSRLLFAPDKWLLRPHKYAKHLFTGKPINLSHKSNCCCSTYQIMNEFLCVNWNSPRICRSINAVTNLLSNTSSAGAGTRAPRAPRRPFSNKFWLFFRLVLVNVIYLKNANLIRKFMSKTLNFVSAVWTSYSF